MNRKISEEIQGDDFSNFNLLDEDPQIEIMRSWNRRQRTNFRMQNTVSEEDVFAPIIKLIDNE